MLPPLDLTLLQTRLADRPVGHTIYHYATVPSTMPLAAALAQDPATLSGTLVVADEQTQGRGRRGRSWQAPPRTSLLVSLLLKPPDLHLPPTHVPMLAAGALIRAVAELLPDVATDLALKWPNDLVLGRDPAQMHKAAGLLAESSLTPDGALAHVVLGIGVNVNQTRADLPRLAPPSLRATSLRLAAGRLVDRTELLARLCEALADGLTQPPAAIHAHWAAHLATLGQAVQVYLDPADSTPRLTGMAVAAAPDGALIVEDDQGTHHTLYAADVTLRPRPSTQR